MQTEFHDRLLTCVDCRSQFVFTAGEQIFFLDKQFKNDPKRCKPCKAKRAALGARTSGHPGTGLTRTETRTECSECHIATTVPFKPTQGRPVLCRQCFQGKRSTVDGDAAAVISASSTYNLNSVPVEAVTDALLQPQA